MAIADDFSISVTGDIRYTGSGTNYTVIALHRWLGDLMDDAQAAGNDVLDITDATASERATDNLITLNSPWNIDDTAAQHLYDGSIVQDGGDTIYDGIVVFAAAGAYLSVIQNGKVITPNFWTTGLNADSANGISHRFMLKVRTGGSDIDLRRLIGQTREFGFTYSEFRINSTSRGNNVLAPSYASDLNNQTAIATVAGWNTITNTEGYRLIDVTGDAVDEPYYSEWNKAALSINDLYERTKWLSRRATSLSACADTGSNYQIGNGTITGQGQSFASGAYAQFATRVFARLKKVGSPTGNLTAKIYAHDGGTFGSTGEPTGAALATSVNIDVSKLTTSYAVTEIGWNTQFELAASTNYFVTFEYSGGDVSNYVHIEGDSTGTHAGNRAENTGTWASAAAEDLNFDLHTSPKLYGLTGEVFRGITHEINVDTPTGNFDPVEPVSWSGGTGQMLAIDSETAGTKMWIQLLTGVPPTNNQVITGTTSGATVMMDTTITERSLSFPFLGQSTGSAIIGGYGVGIEDADLTANDKLFDLGNVQRTPPNNVTFTVNGLVSAEDRVLVGPESGGFLDVGQFALDVTLNGAGETAIEVDSAIPTDTPSSGTVRVQLNSGIYRRVPYLSYTGTTFTIASTDFSSDPATAGNDVFISYIDKLATSTSEAFTVVFFASRSLFVRVRDGGVTPIKTFETTGTLGSAGGSATAIRTTDS